MKKRVVSRRGAMALGTAVVGAASAGTSAGANAGTGDWSVAAGETRTVALDTVLAGGLVIAPGGRVEVAAGAVLRVLGDVRAPAATIFTGQGRVDLLGSRVLAARPEWWGAAADVAELDCRPAFDACLRAHPVMALGPGDYRLAGTWVIDRPNRRVEGIGRTKDARGTRLLLATGGAGTVIQVGTERAPASINSYLAGVVLCRLELGRTAPAGVFADDPPTALKVRHVLDCVFEELRANEHAVGFSLRGAVRSFLRDCCAFRSQASDPAGRDTFVGFDLDGRAPPFRTGANASLTLLDCNATLGNAPRLAVSVGARLLGAMSDTTLVRFETSAVATGIALDGAGAGAAGHYDQIDVHIQTPVLDGCVVGLDLARLGAEAMAEIGAPYVGLAAGGRTAIALTDVAGSVRIDGGQLVGGPARGSTGVLLDRTTGVAVAGPALLGFAAPVVARSSSAGRIDATVLRAGAGAWAAVTVNGCHHLHVAPRLAAAARGYAAGVAVDAASRAITVESAAIDPGALPGPDAVVTVADRPARAAAGTSAVTIP